jgi:molybdopterin converting factor subunit 1
MFAMARDLCGQREVEIELPVGSTVADLRVELARRSPALASQLPYFALAINADYVSDQITLHEGDSVACIPPVSGG